VREFIVKNYRMYLSIIDSQFRNQKMSTDVEKFIGQLKGSYPQHEKDLLDVHILLRAGRSLYLKIDEKELIREDIDLGKKIINQPGKRKTDIEELLDKTKNFDSFTEDIIEKQDLIFKQGL